MSRRPSSMGLTLLFLALGAGAFLLESWIGERGDELVEVTAADVQRLGELWRTQTGRPPTRVELDALLGDFVREEILVREARRLGLHRDDIIIRRRLAQKMSFLMEDTAQPAPPTDVELRSWFGENREELTTPRRTTFRHVFLSGEEEPVERAEEVLAELESGTSWRDLGDPFMLQREIARRSDRQIDDLFGPGFAQRLAELEVGAWSGPVPSALGWHLVDVVERAAPEAPEFESVRARVTERWLEERRRVANREAYEEIAAGYQVVLPPEEELDELSLEAGAREDGDQEAGR